MDSPGGWLLLPNAISNYLTSLNPSWLPNPTITPNNLGDIASDLARVEKSLNLCKEKGRGASLSSQLPFNRLVAGKPVAVFKRRPTFDTQPMNQLALVATWPKALGFPRSKGKMGREDSEGSKGSPWTSLVLSRRKPYMYIAMLLARLEMPGL